MSQMRLSEVLRCGYTHGISSLCANSEFLAGTAEMTPGPDQKRISKHSNHVSLLQGSGDE